MKKFARCGPNKFPCIHIMFAFAGARHRFVAHHNFLNYENKETQKSGTKRECRTNFIRTCDVHRCSHTIHNGGTECVSVMRCCSNMQNTEYVIMQLQCECAFVVNVSTFSQQILNLMPFFLFPFISFNKGNRPFNNTFSHTDSYSSQVNWWRTWLVLVWWMNYGRINTMVANDLAYECRAVVACGDMVKPTIICAKKFEYGRSCLELQCTFHSFPNLKRTNEIRACAAFWI